MAGRRYEYGTVGTEGTDGPAETFRGTELRFGTYNCGSWCQSRHDHPGRRCIVDLRIAFVRAERLEAKDVEGELQCLHSIVKMDEYTWVARQSRLGVDHTTTWSAQA